MNCGKKIHQPRPDQALKLPAEENDGVYMAFWSPTFIEM